MRPFEDQFENYKIIITESIIAINTILFSISESLILFSKIDFLAIFGWIEIVGFSFILLSSLILDFYQQLGKPTRQIYQILQKCVSKTTLDNSNSANPIIKETVVKFF
ncbi:unnamed protein product [Paramecium sonneborni]|uniref:Uncharacterized protein n=1 Tax=Paramecium sonneborni TaxID=65129 RepID=A0A8S1QWW7_9CILI|nr:unnamed protein product [Paramecium sonneborni]